MCLDRLWWTGFAASAIDPWLSPYIVSVSFVDIPLSWLSGTSQFNSLQASDRPMYSDSVVESATMSCCLLLHEMGPPLWRVTKPEVDLRLSVSPMKSLSLYACRWLF